MMQSTFVSPAWLADHLHDEDVHILDARMAPPGQGGTRDMAAEYLAGHIPGARFFDIEALSDHDTGLPHMMPDAGYFARAMGNLGISDRHHLVIYDDGTLFSAPRAWWMLKTFGVAQVSILAGGLAAWKLQRLPLQLGEISPEPTAFTARLNPARIASLDDMQLLVQDGSRQIVDARAAARFSGSEPEPRPGLRAGHIPGSFNVPWTELTDSGALKSPDALRDVFTAHGVALDEPITVSCGSGVTASVLALALHTLGVKDVKLYDGSWSEWGSRQDTIVETGNR
ncbi:3-mercaptopyruvate sulfurtransferase [Enterobacillus tribolii]|uniref:Sulfurtransferase n=1 Tax=Enterobacillus tribolii TaxID=1487935 RepID=A0A370R3G4_9GAMM|nr:3-mercaptopyruvate sulfurtransferase [Enterobacillus tribolii]MBW7984027.1 3-mercaptopyruvate sulfurtransferase [Enterobacillus tribolii]RDK96968.1 thiosulfate/3-mercaptopyruvate sulfurtransferase [Enterobacillus tribolii]